MVVRRFGLVLAVAVLAACQGMGGKEISGSGDQVAVATVEERFVNEPGRRVLKLTNGLTIILEQNKTAPVAAARVYVKAGAITEQQFMGAGISHVLEHLVAGASSGKRKERENTLLLLQIGNDSNAYTDSDHTCYFITTSSDKLPVALDLLLDFTTNTDFTREQFDREFKVVQREIEMGEAEADRIFYQRTLVTRYNESAVRHPIIGYKAAFQTITYEQAKAYYKSMYVPDNMIVSVAGDFDLDVVETLITEQVKGVKRGIVRAVALPGEPAVVVPRRSVAHTDVKQARVQWAFPTTDMYSPDLYATDMLAAVLGGSESSMLVKKVKDDLNLVVDISCYNPTPRYVQGQLEITALLDAEKLPAAEKAVMEVLEGVVKNGVAAEDLARAKAQAAASMVYGNQTAEQKAVRNALDYLATGSIDYTEAYVKRLQNVTPEQVQAAARKYVSKDALLTTVVLPNGVKDPVAVAAGAQQTAANVAVKKTVLKNGVTVLISRNPAAPLAAFSLYTVGGVLAENEQNNGIGAATMALMERGTETRTHEEIAKYLDATGTTLSATSGNNSFSITMQCLKEKAPEAFALFADVALKPKFAAEELGKIREPLVAGAELATEDWFNEAYKATKEVFYEKSPYRLMSTGKAEVLEKVTPEQLRAHYQNYFLNPQKMVIAISGDIDEAEAARWAAAFEGIPQRSPALAMATSFATPKTVKLHTDKPAATILVAYPGITIADPDRYAITILQTYLGGYASQGGSKLFETLRGLGLVYTATASDFSGVAGGMFLISAQGEPQNADAIVAKIKQIVEEVRGGNLPDHLLAAAKDQVITGEKLAKQTIAAKSGQEALDEALGLGWDDSQKFPERIRAVTKEDVVRVARKYLASGTVVVMTPDVKK